MKLAIFGGTGRTGQHLVQLALEQGHEVTVLARNPAKITQQPPNLSVVTGDVKDRARVEQVLAGANAALSVLGPASNRPVREVSQGMANILAAMQAQGVRRLIITAGAGVADPRDTPNLFNHVMNFLLKRMAANVLADMTQAVELVRASDRDWTVVRLPMLTDDPKSGHVRVGYVGQGMGPRIARAGVAAFLLRQVTDQTCLRQSPAISN
jgi:putative NADH-flavin reductase